MCKKKHFWILAILSVLQRFVESCAHILLSPNVWQYTGNFEAGKCFYIECGPLLETCCTSQRSRVHSVYTCSVYMSQVGSNLRLSNYTHWDLVILTNHRRALSYVLRSDWSIRWLEKKRKEKKEMNCHLLIMSRRTDKGCDKNVS